MAAFPKRRRSQLLLCAGGILLLCAAKGHAFSVGSNRQSTLYRASSTGRRPTSAVSAEPSTTHALQSIWDELVSGAELQDVERLLIGVETGLFPQASAWAKTWTPMRCVVAEVADSLSISVLVLPRGTKLEWQRHDKAESVSRTLFGSLKVEDFELQGSDNARKLEQQELEATYTDAWAVGGSEESDCVCRGGRCPRMWDCPFWVDRRRAEAKGSSAHVAVRVSERDSDRTSWRAGRRTVRRVDALEPSALVEVHTGPRNTRYYKEIPSQIEQAVELIEILAPSGVKPGVGRYLGPSVDL